MNSLHRSAACTMVEIKHAVIYLKYASMENLSTPKLEWCFHYYLLFDWRFYIGFNLGKKSRLILVKFQTSFTVFSGKQFQTLNLLGKFHFHLRAIQIQYLDLFIIFYVNSWPFPDLLVQIPDLFQTLSHEKKIPTISRSGISKWNSIPFFKPWEPWILQVQQVLLDSSLVNYGWIAATPNNEVMCKECLHAFKTIRDVIYQDNRKC